MCKQLAQIPSLVDSIRDAVFTVSPNKQYRGILVPTTPATTGPVWDTILYYTKFTTRACSWTNHNWPEWMPARIFSCVVGLCGILNSWQTLIRSRAMLAISPAWLIPFSFGTPETTISEEDFFVYFIYSRRFSLLECLGYTKQGLHASPMVSTL